MTDKKQTEQRTESKYAQKKRGRRKAAAKLGLPLNTPWPVIWQHPDYKSKKGSAK